MTVSFRAFPQLNGRDDRTWASSRSYLRRTLAARHFGSDTLQDKLARAIAELETIPVKEVLECFECFARIRKNLKCPHIADLCCGHGLLGLLFAVFERKVEHVYLIDKTDPPCRQLLQNAVVSVAPWVVEKLTHLHTTIVDAAPMLPEGTAVVCAHACGTLTDECIDLAIKLCGHVAAMPCCYPKTTCPAPQAVRLSLGHELAYDVDRSYRLAAAGYHVRWTEIPHEITPMNRIIVGYPQQGCENR